MSLTWWSLVTLAMMEAALIAASGQGRRLTYAELDALIDQLGWTPALQKLN